MADNNMPLVKSLTFGDLFVLAYEFVEIGKVLPMHNHNESTSHIIIVTKGEVLVVSVNPEEGYKVDSIKCTAGMILDTKAFHPHAIVGLTPGARTVHIPKKLAGQRVAAEVTYDDPIDQRRPAEDLPQSA